MFFDISANILPTKTHLAGEFMKRFVIEQSEDEFYTTHAGLAFIGPALNRFTSLARALSALDAPADLISNMIVITSYCALLAEGKSDFTAIEQHRRDDLHFRTSLGMKSVPSEATLRLRMDERAEQFLAPVSWASVEFLERIKAPVTALGTGHVPLDIDGFIMDNSGSKKELVERTYQQVDGYLALPAYLGLEGWMINLHLLPGSQHPQKEFISFIRETLGRVRQFCKKKLLLRADSAHDAIANLCELSRHDKVDWIIKWNPRKQDLVAWARRIFTEGSVATPRPGKRIGTMSVYEKYTFTDTDGIERKITLRRVVRITERTIDKKGQQLLIPEYELEGWWTSLKAADQEIIDLYKGHATCEQYHAEIKTDMDLERLPSGKFATNQLVMVCGALVYNILRFMGQVALVNAKGIIRHEAKRRRIKTVMQELIYFAGRVIASGRRLILRFSRHVTGHAQAFAALYQRIAYG
jgi:hypothetical protein